MTDQKNRKHALSTRLAQALHFVEEDTGAVIPAIQPAATYARDENYEIRKPYWYRRDGSQTTSHAEAVIAEMEGAADSLLFSSGMSACTAVIEHLPTGAHVVAPKVMYHGVLHQLQTYEAKQRLSVSYYTAGNLEELAAAVRPGETNLVWVETPNNPNWEVTDIAAAAEIAHGAGAKLMCDCTGTPPSMTRALEFGADISFHSATKYLNGHSDVVAGLAVVGANKDLAERLGYLQNAVGGVLDPFSSFLTLRGIRTLSLRVEKHSANALAIAQWLEQHPQIESVLYPGLESHPQYALARRQMALPGGMISVVIKGDAQRATEVIRHLTLFTLAESLGGVESLVSQPYSMTHASIPLAQRLANGIVPQLIRLSVGIEDAKDLIADLQQALEK